jgi:uncharacterized protein YaeQ
MALTATMYRFELSLSDVDRGVYETIELRVAQHPSESDAYLITRVLAMALEYREDLTFGRGISTPEDPGLSAPDQMGGVALWIDIGHPSADRLHKVTKQAEDVRVYTHKSADPILADLASGDVHRGDEVVVVEFDHEFIDGIAGALSRNTSWDILRNEGVLYVTIDEETFETTPVVHSPQR